MRLLATYKSLEEAHDRYLFLLQNKVDCRLEEGKDGGELWITHEDQHDLAKELLSKYTPEKSKPLVKEEEGIHKAKVHQPPPISGFNYHSPFTKLFILVCIAIFVVSVYQYTQIVKKDLPVLPVITPIQERLMYDAPPVMRWVQEFSQKYPIKSLDEIKTLPPEGQMLYLQIRTAPFWSGLYPYFLGEESQGAPLFTDIRKGEVWRIFTPIVLHGNFFHILFNMLWLWLLGKMIEHNIGGLRYLSFILITAAVTNTAQYLVSGPFFMGFSGVVAAMAGFIWVRKKKAPWEAYAIDFWVLKLLWIFIFGFLAVQIVVFILRMVHITSFELPFANAAHVIGVALGLGLGYTRLFNGK